MSNSGVAFGISLGHTGLYLLLIGVAMYFFVILASRMRYLAPSIALILAGGASNGLDRVLLGFVRDPVSIGAWSGNLADIFIGVGVLWSVWVYIKK
jgi:lipoprotein signal peptidase